MYDPYPSVARRFDRSVHCCPPRPPPPGGNMATRPSRRSPISRPRPQTRAGIDRAAAPVEAARHADLPRAHDRAGGGVARLRQESRRPVQLCVQPGISSTSTSAGRSILKGAVRGRKLRHRARSRATSGCSRKKSSIRARRLMALAVPRPLRRRSAPAAPRLGGEMATRAATSSRCITARSRTPISTRCGTGCSPTARSQPRLGDARGLLDRHDGRRAAPRWRGAASTDWARESWRIAHDTVYPERHACAGLPGDVARRCGARRGADPGADPGGARAGAERRTAGSRGCLTMRSPGGWI